MNENTARPRLKKRQILAAYAITCIALPIPAALFAAFDQTHFPDLSGMASAFFGLCFLAIIFTSVVSVPMLLIVMPITLTFDRSGGIEDYSPFLIIAFLIGSILGAPVLLFGNDGPLFFLFFPVTGLWCGWIYWRMLLLINPHSKV